MNKLDVFLQNLTANVKSFNNHTLKKFQFEIVGNSLLNRTNLETKQCLLYFRKLKTSKRTEVLGYLKGHVLEFHSVHNCFSTVYFIPFF
jgi:hypothetical protein